jgi:hypothetical protein
MNTMSFQHLPNEIIEYLTLAQVSSLCALSMEEANELVEYGAIRFDKIDGDEGYLATNQLEPLRIACQLRRDFDMDLFTVVISVAHLKSIADLKQQLHSYRVLSRFDNS